MNCTEALELLDLYLDGELGGMRLSAFEEHLGRCPACAARDRAERRVRLHIAAVSATETAPAELRERIHAQVRGFTRHVDLVAPALGRAGTARGAEASDSRHVRTRAGMPLRGPSFGVRRVSLRYAVALAAMLAAAVVLSVLGPRGAVESGWAADLARDHTLAHGASGTENVLNESDPGELTRWLERRVRAPVVLPERPSNGHLLGGRVCLVNGRRVAHAIYRVRGSIASYYVVPELGGSGATAQGRVDDLNYVAWGSPRARIFVMGSAPASELARLKPE